MSGRQVKATAVSAARPGEAVPIKLLPSMPPLRTRVQRPGRHGIRHRESRWTDAWARISQRRRSGKCGEALRLASPSVSPAVRLARGERGEGRLLAEMPVDRRPKRIAARGRPSIGTTYECE
jgi:hypothetical protein